MPPAARPGPIERLPRDTGSGPESARQAVQRACNVLDARHKRLKNGAIFSECKYVGEAKVRENTAAAKRNLGRDKILVYLPLRGTVMTLLQANAVLRAREPYVLMTPGERA